jgi:Na+-transporting methylmalonyl-CoA/oxaloacetate decarboxylase gamma subunit
MLETELFLLGMGVMALLAYLIIPKWMIPYLKERFEKEEKAVKRSFSSYKCNACGSAGRHRNDCPNNPKNKVKT